MNWPQIHLSTKAHRKRDEFRYQVYALLKDLDLQKQAAVKQNLKFGTKHSKLAYNKYIKERV